MDQKQNHRGFFFALLLGILAISGVSAKEASLSCTSEGQVLVSESVASADEAPFWAVQEAFTEFSLPEYSENQFLSGLFLFQKSDLSLRIDKTATGSTLGFGRDLKAAISIQIFPFHFFL